MGGEEWTPIGTSNNPFEGSFDGQGYTVKNLSILSPTSDNLGLFGYVNGGTVRNLTVAGSIQTSKNSVGGVIGLFTGPDSLLENCVNQVDVTGNTDVGGLGWESVNGTQAKTIQNCVNQGDISANNAAGGLVGYFYYKGDLINCYNTGNVTATTSKAGGLVGYMNDSNAKVTNCYTIGTVTGGSSIQAGIGSKSSGAVANCYALEGLPADANVTFQTAAYMKSAAFLDDLGEAFQADVSGSVNNGYPIFSFQDDTVYYTAAITVNDAAAKVTLQGPSGTPFTPVSSEDGVFTYQLPAGVYTYSVSAFGKVSQTGLTLTVVDQAVAASVTLEQAPAYQTDFQITYADGNPNSVTPAIQVKWEGRVIEAQAGGGYLLPDGDYTYSISATGYSKEQGSFTVAGQSQTIEKELTVYTGWDGVSTAKPEGDGTAAQPYQISTAEELAWFAGLVNGTLTDGNAQNTGAYGVLTEDIHLYEKEWTPIGTGISSLSYTGVFDGGNHTVSGLKVTDNGNGSYGFFGSLKGATVQNVTVQGQVTADITYTTGAIGGLAGTATGDSQILNCGNQADVTSNYGATGGILGSATPANGATISRCYNTGTISYTGSSNAGGILGQQNDAITITDCYNTGAVTSSGNGNRTSGIAGNLGYSSKVINCYNTGTISANSSKQYAITYAYSGTTLTNCHYLEGLTVADAAASTAQSQTTMTSEAFPAVLGENWKTDGIGQNRRSTGYPVLQWQTVVPGGEEPGTQLATPYAQWQHGYTEEGQAYVTLHAVWQGIDHASSYTIQLYNWAGDVLATVTGITTDDSSYDKATNTFTYDLEPTLQQAATEAGVNDAYQFTVIAVGDGTVYVDSQESLKAGPVEYVVTKIGSPLAGAWQGEDLPIARWDYTDFAAYYTVNLYKDGVLNTSVSTAYTYFDFSAYIRAAGDYTFTVVACPANGEAYDQRSFRAQQRLPLRRYAGRTGRRRMGYHLHAPRIFGFGHGKK